MFDPQPLTDMHDDRSRRALLSSGVGIASVDLEGRWRAVNPALERMLDFPAAQLLGREVVERIHPEDAQAASAALVAVLAGAPPTLQTRLRCLRRDGAWVWTQASLTVMRDDDGRPSGLVAQLQDIGSQCEAEQALQASHQALIQRLADAETALATMGRQQEAFAYGVSHDLRAPLRAIDSFAALLDSKAHAMLDDSSREYLARIRAAATRMGALIDALLQLSRAQRAQYQSEAVDLSLLAEWCGAELQDREPGRSAQIEVEPGLLVQGDEHQLKLMLTQLLHNAWKFSRARDRIRIEVRGERTDGCVQVSIRDHGTGFDMRYADKLFEPFQRLHGPDEGGGSGLGLAIAHAIVARHGGRIRAESGPGRGSCFHLQLPAAAIADPANEPEPAERTS